MISETLRHFDLDELEVSEQDLLHGAALAAAELPARAEGPRAAGRLYLLLGGLRRRRRLVLGQAAHDRLAREDAEEAAVLDDRDALEAGLAHENERLVERRVGTDRRHAGIGQVPRGELR